MRQVIFRLFRHGPLHNQLLSPLTQYLAICGNHPATTVRLPFEHHQLLNRLRALNYRADAAARTFEVADTGHLLAGVLSQVPELSAELRRSSTGVLHGDAGEGVARAPDDMTHLQLVISASELSLLPFELAVAPPGFPGAGQPLALQSDSPICITRETWLVGDRRIDWPREPRILFAAADPERPVPLELHLTQLRQVLQPWIWHGETEEERRAFEREHLVVLQNATCQDIERECSTGGFSHVHILAHGKEFTGGMDLRYGVALHDAANPRAADVVSGERLAFAIRPMQGNGTLARAPVVTLASCDSSNQGGVGGLGGSVAHALHAAGIPLVVASQFLLTEPASRLLVEVLYEALLWGKDPRVALMDLRRRLYSNFPQTHDWASVTAYLAVPADFDVCLSEFRITQTMRSMEAQMNFADRATSKLMRVGPGAEMSADETRSLEEAQDRVERGRERLERLLRETNNPGRVYGLLAATEKRCAEVFYSLSCILNSLEKCLAGIDLLAEARRHYWSAFQSGRDNSWGAVQYLSLDLLLRRLLVDTGDLHLGSHEEHNSPNAIWTVAYVMSMNDLRTRDEIKIRWALGNLVELFVLQPLIFKDAPNDAGQRKASQYAQELRDRAGADAFEVYSTRRQLLRYKNWYSKIAKIDELQNTVESALKELPLSRSVVRTK